MNHLNYFLELLENEPRRTAKARWGWGWTHGYSRKRAKENFEYDSAGRNWTKAPPPAGLAPPFFQSSLSSALQWRNAMCPEHFKFSVSSIIWDISNFNFDAVDQSQSQCAKSGFKIFTKKKFVKKDLIGHSLKLFVNVSLSSHKHNPSGINFDILWNR